MPVHYEEINSPNAIRRFKVDESTSGSFEQISDSDRTVPEPRQFGKSASDTSLIEDKLEMRTPQ